MELAMPPFATLLRLLDACTATGVIAAVGGSALLASDGLINVVHDWDVTTDAPVDVVARALDRLQVPFHDRTVGHDPYHTQQLVTVNAGDHSIDVIVGFSLLDDHGRVVELPTRISGWWRGLPMADPAVWQLAYTLLGRLDRAELLQQVIDASE
jgi:hypothetical protein